MLLPRIHHTKSTKFVGDVQINLVCEEPTVFHRSLHRTDFSCETNGSALSHFFTNIALVEPRL